MDIASTILGVLVPLVIHYARPSEQGERKLNDLYWQIPVGGFGALFLFKLIRAPYLVWRNEEEKKKNAENQRDELQKQLDDRKPKLSAEICYVTISEADGDGGSVIPVIVATVLIRNTGTPSIADNFSLNLQTPDGEVFEGRIEVIKDGTKIPDDDGSRRDSPGVILNSSDTIFNKTLTPIPNGGKVIGYLRASFPLINRKLVQQTGNTFTTSFQDVYGKSHSASLMFGELKPTPVSRAPRHQGERI